MLAGVLIVGAAAALGLTIGLLLLGELASWIQHLIKG